MTLFEMLTFEYPFDFTKSQDKLVADMLSQNWQWSANLKNSPPSASLDSLMRGMLNPDPRKRLRLAKLMTHEWVADEYKAAHDLSDQIKEEQFQNKSPPAEN